MRSQSLEEAAAVHPPADVADEISGGRDIPLSCCRVTEPTQSVSLHAPYLVYYGVVAGRKTVYADGQEAHTLHAGESLLVPPLRSVRAGFPSADQTPAQWLAFKVDQNTVETTLDQLDLVARSKNGHPWDVRERPFCHVEEQEGIRRALENVAFLFREDPPHRDTLLDLSAQQLLISLLQTPAHALLVNGLSRHSADGGLAAAVQYIQDHLDRHISIDELVEQACMSKSTFYRHFSDEFDKSPLEYITEQRVIRACHLLSSTDKTVADVSRDLGFSSTSYFIDMFKEHVGQTPKQYQLAHEASSSEVETV